MNGSRCRSPWSILSFVLWIVFVCTMSGHRLPAQQTSVLAEFEAARASFEQGNFAAAYDRLSALAAQLADGNLSPTGKTTAADAIEVERGLIDLHLGHCALALDRPAEASFYYRRAALRIDHPKVADAVTLAQSRFRMQDLQGSTQPSGGLLFDLQQWNNPLLIAWTLALIQTLALCLLWTNVRSILKWLAVLLVLGTAAGLLLLVVAHGPGAAQRPVDAIVFDRGTNVRTRPDETAATPLRAGTTVRVLSIEDPFVRVEHRTGIGYVDRKDIGIVAITPWP